jgi:hypothetical protein
MFLRKHLQNSENLSESSCRKRRVSESHAPMTVKSFSVSYVQYRKIVPKAGFDMYARENQPMTEK